MKILRNIPIVLWWLIGIAIIIKLHVALMVAALILLLAAPFKRLILDTDNEVDDCEVVAPLCATKAQVLQTMTALTAVKVINYTRKGADTSPIKILDMTEINR